MDATIEQNRNAWDALARIGEHHTLPARDEEFRDPLSALDSQGWLGPDLRGQRVLCLAAGGGRQAPLFAAAGAEVTVVDISPEMLAADRRVARRHGLKLRTVESSIDDLSILEPSAFDVVAQPVSTCYVRDVRLVYRQVARVLRPGGLYVSQHKQPASLQTSAEPSPRGYDLTEPYYRRGPLPPVANSPHREGGTLEFLHRWEDLIGGLCQNGFVIEDLVEPFHARPDANAGSFAHRCRFVPPYVRIKARRVKTGADAPDTNAQRRATIWNP